MALLELCSIPAFDCSSLVVCLDRNMEAGMVKDMTRDLGWVGFEPITLAQWALRGDLLSDKWLFLAMDV